MSSAELLDAIKRGDLLAVVSAMDAGADLEARDQHGYPGLPLRTACFLGHPEIVVELLKRGADPIAANADGLGAPMRMAKRGGNAQVLEVLERYAQPLPAVGQNKLLEPLEFVPTGMVSPQKAPVAPSSLQVALEKQLVEEPVSDVPLPAQASPAENAQFEEPAAKQPLAVLETSRQPLDEPLEEGEQVRIEACYGVDTNVLDEDLLRMSNSGSTGSPSPVEEPAPALKPRFWQRK